MAQGPGEARHYIAAARVPPQVRSCASSSSFAPTVLYSPPKPRNPTGTCDSLEFRFSQDPQNNRTQRGSESHVPVWVSGGLGLQVKVHGAPSWHKSWGASLKELVSRWPFTPGPYLPIAYQVSVSDITLLDWRVKSTERGRGMLVDRVQRWDEVTFLIDFQHENPSP